MRELLDADVRWHGAGDADGGCQNREQAMVWMTEAIRQGITVELIDARAIDESRVLVLLHRRPDPPNSDPPAPHGQLLSFRDGKVVEMVVYPTAEEAVAAAAA